MNCKFRTSDLSGTGQIGTWTYRYLDTWHSWVETSHFPASRIVYTSQLVFFMQDHVDVNAHVLIPTNHLIISKCHLWKVIMQTFIKKCARDYWKRDIFGLSDFRTIGPSPYKVHLALAGLELTMLVVIATDYLGSCQSIYHTTMTAPYINIRQPLILYVVVNTEVDTFCLYICIAD